MDEVEVDIAALRTAGTRVSEAAEQAGGVDLAARVSEIGTAMPGSTAASQAQALATAWRAELEAFVTGARRHGTGLKESANGYARHEAEATSAFEGAR